MKLPVPTAPRSATVWLAAAMLGGLVASGMPLSDAQARDITLGGHRAEQQGKTPSNELPYHLPENVLSLPRMVASVQNHETGQWQRVLVDAYLQPADARTFSQTRDHLKDIVARAKPQLQSRPAEFLEEAHGGTRTAKDCIQLAANQSLGHNWAGTIFIRSLAVF